MLLFADTGWDPAEQWSPSVLAQLADFHCFLPNSVEAMAYTHTDDPHDALHALADRVPVAVVTCGGQGALGDRLDDRRGGVGAVAAGQRARPDRRRRRVRRGVRARDARSDWPLKQRLAFANLCAALSVQYVGGSLAAPGWGDIVDWLAGMRARAAAGSSTAADYVDVVRVRRRRAAVVRTDLGAPRQRHDRRAAMPTRPRLPAPQPLRAALPGRAARPRYRQAR